MSFDLLKEDFASILSSIEEGLFISDMDRNVLFINTAALAMLGYSAREVVGKKCDEIMRSELCKNKCSISESILSNGLITRHEIQLTKSDGSSCFCRGRTAKFQSSNGNYGVIHLFIDITELVNLRRQLSEALPRGCFLTRSPTLRETLAALPELANSDVSILIMGETGTGKEMLARDIHHFSRRRDRSLVPVICCSMPENLFEAELFGHIAGAFTDAKKSRMGRIEMADGGTVFLDEIGDMPLVMQPKILRLLQERCYEPLGSSESKAANVRFVSASKSDIPNMVKAGKFREDLFYRINTVTIRIPPLRERPEDIPLLVLHFLKKFQEASGKCIQSISREVMDLFLKHPWPGNVRQLEHAIEHGFILSKGDEIQIEHLPGELLSSFCATSTYHPSFGLEDLRSREKEIILDFLMKHQWKKASVCKELGVSRSTLWRKMKDLQIPLEPVQFHD